jgi:ComF family protein
MLQTAARRALDLLLPPACPLCSASVHAQGTLCASCFPRLAFIADPACTRCGLPFANPGLAGFALTCPTCEASPPPWRLARAALLYDPASAPLILALKHGDRLENAPLLAAHMARAGAPLLATAEVLVPVPLHRWRLFRRRYNQSALIARALARRTGLRLSADALRRVRRTRSLGPLDAAARRRELEGAITVRRGREGAVRGRRILLIDDVLTSGATAAACTRALLAAGAASVDLLVASRVPDPRDDRRLNAEPDEDT